MRGAHLLGRVCLAITMAGVVWGAALVGPVPTTSAKQGLAIDKAQLNSLVKQLRAEGDLAAQSQVTALLVKIKTEQAYLVRLNAQLAGDQATATLLSRQMSADRTALMSLVSTAYVDGTGSQAIAEALAAPNISQFLNSTTLPSAIAAQVATLVGNIQHDRRVVAGDTLQLRADQAQAMASQQQLGVQSQQLLSQLAAPIAAPLSVAGIGSGGSTSSSFAFGDCTWYVATQRAVTWGGNADQWWANAAAAGYLEGQTPKVGSIVVWGPNVPGESYSYGHVAYVEAVQGNRFEVSEMNFGVPGGGWDRVDFRWVMNGAGYLGFIYNRP
ncbi:MAG: CHAP domain-containing protein [Candidatus Dormibacteria bacterium]